jgi:dienelactone hydrolase
MTELEPRARAFVETLARHDWPAAEARFDAKMAEFLPGDKLEAFWMDLESHVGGWARVDAIKLEKKDIFDVALVTCRFDRLRRMLRVTFGRDGRVAGLFVGPVPEEIETATRDLVAALVRGDFVGASKGFDATMRSALPPEKLADAWRGVQGQVGAFVAIERVRLEPKGRYWISFARCRFERNEMVIKVVYDGQNQVAGLFFLDAAADVAWTVPPYANPAAFEEREVTVGSAPSLPGALAMPKGAGPFPAVVLVHGSGPQDADETVGGVKVFKDLALGLASRGVAVVRYVKRTSAFPRGVVTVKEEVIDAARAAVDLLIATPGIDATRVVVLGHSQGGYLAPRIAHEDARIAGVVILAGNTRPLEDLLVEQLRYLASQAPGATHLQGALKDAIRFKSEIEDPALTPGRAMMPVLGGGMTGAYFLDLRGYHPEKVAADLACPLFIVRGERDFQVGEADFDGWKNALGALPRVTLRQYSGCNHLFVVGTGPSTPAEYEKPGHVDLRLVEDIATWVGALPTRAARSVVRG